MKDRKLWEKRLKSLKNYKEEKEKSDSLGSTLPPARYSGRIVSAEMTEASSKDLMIRVNMVVENDEEHDGVEQPSFLNLGEKSLRFSLATLKRLGYELSGDDTSEILDVVEELSDSGMGVNFKVGTSGFANILGPVDEGKEETSNESEEEVEEDKEESDEEEMNEDEESDEEESDEEDEDEEEDEEDEEDDEEDEVNENEISEGSAVSWKKGKESKTGIVIEIDEKNNTARVESDENGKIVSLSVDVLSVVSKEDKELPEDEEEDEEEVEEVKPRTKTKTGEKMSTKSAPAKKVTKTAKKKIVKRK